MLIFRDDFLSTQVAMRGGTLLHKVHLPPPSRYSEDIDLVVVGDRPGDISNGPCVGCWKRFWENQGAPNGRNSWPAIRNAHKPSRILRMNYSVPSITAPGTSLEIQIETNVTERQSYQPVQKIPFGSPPVASKSNSRLAAMISTKCSGTKLRALFQRDKGRVPFSIYIRV